MLSAVTISLVPEARGGPFVFWDDLELAARTAAELGFDALEVFSPDIQSLTSLRFVLQRYNLKLAALGTGAGWVKHKLRLTAPDADERQRAMTFVKGVIDAAGEFGAPAIIGSMQGRWGDGIEKDACLAMLADALGPLAAHAKKHGAMLIYEPLNRYETNLVNDVAAGVKVLHQIGADNIKLLADLFHMNIEEADIARAIRAGGHNIGHVHLADSNRRPAGCGHTDFVPIAEALRQIGYAGYISAEALPYPDSQTAARHTIEAFRKHFA
jgi:sugar phosphate isomerase/epimerase